MGMKRILILALISGLSSACQPSAPGPSAPGPAEPVGEEEVVHEIDLGDVEQAFHFNITLPERSKAPNVTVEENADFYQRVNYTEIHVTPPIPEELWLDVVLRCKDDLKGNPIVLRGKYLVAETQEPTQTREVQPFALLFAEKGFREIPQGSIEILQGFDSAPDSICVRVEAEALMLPRDMDLTTVDPATVTTSPDRVTEAITGTVVVVNFEQAETPAEGQ